MARISGIIYPTIRILALRPSIATSSARYRGGFRRDQGLSPWCSIHRPISADRSSGQVVQKVGVIRQHGRVPCPGNSTSTWHNVLLNRSNTRRLDSARTRNPAVPPCQPLTINS